MFSACVGVGDRRHVRTCGPEYKRAGMYAYVLVDMTKHRMTKHRMTKHCFGVRSFKLRLQVAVERLDQGGVHAASRPAAPIRLQSS